MGLGKKNWSSVFHFMLFVPNLKRNLFSLAKAIDRSMIDVYDKKHCKLYANCGRGSLLLAVT
jgi:hypothetical protein